MTTGTEPTTELYDEAERLQQQVAEDLDRRVLGDDDQADDGETEQTIDIVVDGRTLTDAEVEALLQKPMEELTDAEREGLQPLFAAATAQQQQGVDPLALASDLLHESFLAMANKPPAAQRLEHKIALGHAMAALVQAQSTRNLMLLTQKQLQIVMEAQQAQVARVAGPAGIHIPQGHVRLHG